MAQQKEAVAAHAVTVADVPEVTPSVIDEILEETRARERAGLLDLERAAVQAQTRVDALKILRNAAIAATQPIHWLLFKDDQGLVFARFNAGGAARVGAVFGVTVKPKGDVAINEEHGARRTAEIFGDVHSEVLGVTLTNIRAYRVEGEDFCGRPAEDKEYPSGYKAVGVGDNDWLQSTATSLYTKGVRLVSGLVTVSPEELREAWNMKNEDEVIKKCKMGHGFSDDERKAASTKPITDGQVRRLFGIAKGRLDKLGTKKPGARAIVDACILKIAGSEIAPDAVTVVHYDEICKAIEAWTPNGESAKQPAADASKSNGAGATPATKGQLDMLLRKATEAVGKYPGVTDANTLLEHAIAETTGALKEATDLTQADVTSVASFINGWRGKL